MRAYVISQAGGPEKLELKEIPTPKAKPGWVLIKVKAIGLNRSEYFTRIGHSPSVKFPRVLGIECVGEVVEGEDLKPGQKVAAMMGEMGRAFDGSYAEYTLVPRAIVFPLETRLDWATLGALPEMIQTTHGSLFTALECTKGQTLLIRGGTSSIGLCDLALAKAHGLTVISTTRNADREAMLKERGADQVIVDTGTIANQSPKVERVLELVGTRTLKDSLKCLKPKGTLCMTGILGGEWTLKDFTPMGDIPSTAKLTQYSGEASNITPAELQTYVDLVESGKLPIQPAKVFSFGDMQTAHRTMDANEGGGKLVVTV